MRCSFYVIGFAVAGACSLEAQDLVLTNARIIDPRTRTIVRGSLVIERGKLAGVTTAPVPQSTRGQRVDVEGKWVIPGLIDLHTHSSGNAAPGRVFDGRGTAHTAERILRAGFTAFLDLFGPEDALFQLRDRQRAGAAGGADLFVAGPCFTASKGHCTEYGIPTRTVDSIADVIRHLGELAPKRPDVIKVVYDHFDYGGQRRPTVERPVFEALLSRSRELGFKTVVHVGMWSDVRDAISAGATAITHVPRDGVVPDDVIRLMSSRRIPHIPTLVVHSDLSDWLQRGSAFVTPLAVALSSDGLRAVYAAGPEGVDERTRRWSEQQRRARPMILESVRRLAAAGVSMLVGTDAGNWGTIQGYSVHRELAHLAAVGMSPWEVLAAATTNAGDFLGIKVGFRPGDVANFVVLDASPLVDIHNTECIALVVKGGSVVFARAIGGSGEAAR